ncbi:hypothetical protein GQ53DRAFT_368913 [Thozetella sp. PMI_491]|nr:hypothetical protein GQ53DRAFT_368913 [Thozetella sp. PMI_491]
MAAMEAANPHHGQQPYPPLPASPTLTNPDMILPDYDYDRADSPSHDLDLRNHSPLMMWKNAQGAAGADLHQMFAVTTPGQQRVDHPYGPTAPITPTTPIIYGNGTMLSDIGEVTEVESTPGKPSPSRYRGMMHRDVSPTRIVGNEDALRSSPTMGIEAIMKKKSKQSMKRERRLSTDSTSTITTQDQANLFADFDDAVSVVDSVFQADDEESVASSYVEDHSAREPARLGIPSSDNADRMSTYSTTSLSRRAEEILANAKKRLTTMEGNLSRARNTLYSPTSLGSDDGSTPSPPFQRAQTALYTHDNDLSTPTSSPGHARQSSEVAIRNGLPYRVSQRSQSALGVAGGYRQPLTSSKSVDHIRVSHDSDDGRPIIRTTPPKDHGLAPLSEDDVVDSSPSNRTSTGVKLEQFLSPTFGTFSSNSDGSERIVQRSASATQMRDLKDQMKDLKGRISGLREQARADSLKRRSLQSLRTPSPFTHSQVSQWYAEPRSSMSSDFDTANEGAGRSPWNGELSSVDGEEPAADAKEFAEDEESVYSEVETRTHLRPADSHSPERKPIENPVDDATEGVLGHQEEDDDDDVSDMLTENGDVEQEQEVLPVGFQEVQDLGYDYDSESGESMYHDTVQHPLSHEDREDAFDYEHFFLHSAMGTMSQQRRGSYSSEGSVETTRGPVVEIPHASRSRSRRRNSDASVSTVETFATADEGSSSKSGGSANPSARASMENFREQIIEIPEEERSESPETARRTSFGPGTIKTNGNGFFSSKAKDGVKRNSDGSISPIPEEGKENEEVLYRQRPSVARRPMSSSAAMSTMHHRPSVSSFESTGTNRSFPLVNKPTKTGSTGVLTPNSSPDQELKSISDTLMSETASICEQQLQGGDIRGHSKANSTSSIGTSRLGASSTTPQAMTALLREDQYLVERLVATLGRCVLGLTESGRASTESRMYRRRIEAARRILEGLDGESGTPL